MPINLKPKHRAPVEALAAAFESNDAERVTEALDETVEAVRNQLAEELAESYKQAVASGDAAVLAQRGFRQLTSEETKYYQRVIDALMSPNPKQAFATIPDKSTDAGKTLPTTVIDQVLEDIKKERPLLAHVKMVNTKILTRWIKSDYTEQFALWGALETAITKEITGGIKVKEVTLNKLSCFGLLSIDMLQLGPTFFDAYLRLALADAMGAALEKAVIMGIGIKAEPIGLMKDPTGSVNQTTGLPDKTATKVTSFDPATYGALVANLSKDHDGKVKKSIGSLTMIVNLTDYLTKIVPATTVLTTSGTYVNDLFPVPTTVVQSEFVPAGKAILALMDEYSMFVGGARPIEYSDEYKFLEDQRTYKTVQYAYGEPKDETSALVLDISELDPAYVTVMTKGVSITVPAGDGQ